MSLCCSFWSHFEEPVGLADRQGNTDDRTLTKAREEPDERLSLLGVTITKTRTGAREEADQDARQTGHLALPRCYPEEATKTLTETREEPDQDATCESYVTIPIRDQIT